MQILLSEKEKKVIDFVSTLNNNESKEKVLHYLVKKGLQGIIKKVETIPSPYKNLIKEFLKDVDNGI